MTTLLIDVPSLGRSAHVRCLEQAAVLAIRRELDGPGDAHALVMASIVRTLREALVDSDGIALLRSDLEAEYFAGLLTPTDLGRVLGAALAADANTTGVLIALATDLASAA